MAKFVLIYLVVLAAFFVIDMIWLGLVAKKFYRDQLGHLMSAGVNWPAAIIFYLLFILGLVFFIVYPAVEEGSWFYALWTGAFFGLICYATYDLTNLATLKNWPVKATIVDLIWGSSLSGILGLIGFLYGRTVL
ncbi:MAG: DUF2177 family protein [Bacillota bacterium]